MRIQAGLAALILIGTCGAAEAVTPSYDYIQLDYVGVAAHEGPDAQGADFQLSALIAPYLFFEAGYQWLQSERVTVGLNEGRFQSHTASAGLGGRYPLVRNLLDGFVSADWLYINSQAREGLEGTVPDEHDNGVRVSGGVRANFRYFEAIPTVRYVHIFDEDDVGFGIQLLGCPGYGFCLTGGYEYTKNAEDSRYFGGLRFYYD